MLVGGSFAQAPEQSSNTSISINQQGEILKYIPVQNLHLLGELFDPAGSTQVSVEHRLALADAKYFREAKVFQARGPVIPRLRAWHSSAGTSATFGCGSWHLSQTLLHDLRSWELRSLRRMFKMRRKPEESYMQFNMRTAGQLERWLRHSGVAMIHQRILKQVYKAAWTEKMSPCGFGANPLAWAREFRDSMWWEGICASSSKRQRLDQGVRHGQSGWVRLPWEYPFTVVFGTTWRNHRNKHSSLAHWMRGCDGFISAICQAWKLPAMDDRIQSDTSIFHLHVPQVIEKPPPLPPHKLDRHWQRNGKRIWVQVDCQTVAEVLAGRAKLDAPDLEPIFIRIARLLLRLRSLSWKPLHSALDFVIWAPREFNSVADHAVNATLDTGESWSRKHESLHSALKRERTCMKLCVDGGLRRNGSTPAIAAAGFALFEARWKDDASIEYQTLAREGNWLEGVESSFHAEAVALELGLSYLLSWLA